MQTLKVQMEYDRATPNTIRYKEETDAPILRNLYVSKSAFTEGVPRKIIVTVEEAKE